MSSDLKAKMLAASARRIESVSVPILGEVQIRSLSAREIREWRGGLVGDDGKPTPRLERANELLVALAVVNDDGSRVFTDDDAMSMLFDDVDSAAFAVLVAAVRKHTNVGADPDWKIIEAAAKN